MKANNNSRYLEQCIDKMEVIIATNSIRYNTIHPTQYWTPQEERRPSRTERVKAPFPYEQDEKGHIFLQESIKVQYVVLDNL